MSNFGDILLERERKTEAGRQVQALKQEVKYLKAKDDALTARQERIRTDLKSGRAGPSSRYRLPLSLLSPSPRDTPKLRAGEVERMAKLAVSRRNLEAIALTTGLTITRETQADSGETKFVFDPVIEGRPHGPFVLRLKFSQGKGVVMRGHKLPQGVAVRQLFNSHFGPDCPDQQAALLPFLTAVQRQLRAFLSREQQCNQLRDTDRFPSIAQFHTSNHCTNVNFELKIENEDTGEDLLVQISMNYAADEERPLPGSLKVDFVPEQEPDQVERVNRDCKKFFMEMTLKDALEECFFE